MTDKEAIRRIREHMIIHMLNEPQAIFITEALNLAITALEERSQGDLISRSALKETMKKRIVSTNHNAITLNREQRANNDAILECIDEIDNAPTVSTKDCEGCPYCPNSNSGIPIGVE